MTLQIDLQIAVGVVVGMAEFIPVKESSAYRKLVHQGG